MEIRPVTDWFPATRLRSGHLPTYSVRIRTPNTYIFSCKLGSDFHHKTGTVEPESRNRMFILGMGFVGRCFARDLQNQGWFLSGTCTNIMKKKKLEEMGFSVHLFDANEPEPEVLSSLSHHTHLLISIPTLAGIGDPMLQHEELLKSTLLDGNLQWLCYLSSTSVYGNCGGAWVNEDYPISCTSEKAKARLAAEEGWLKLGHDLGLSTQMFRLGGIYGPGRSAIDTLIKQEGLSESQRMRTSKNYTSRVHVADICQALKASIHKPSAGKIYNVVDDDPASRIEVFSFARDLIEKKWPDRVKQAPSPDRTESSVPQRRSSRGEKRVSNARMKKELGVQLLHPSYKSGLQSIIDSIDSLFL